MFVEALTPMDGSADKKGTNTLAEYSASTERAPNASPDHL